MTRSLRLEIQELKRRMAFLEHVIGLQNKPKEEQSQGDWKDVLIDLSQRGKDESPWFADAARRAGFATVQEAKDWAAHQRRQMSHAMPPQTQVSTREGWGE